MAKLAERLLEGTLVYVQGELTTRDRERTIKVPNGDAFIEHVVKQLEVEVKADVIRILDRRSSGDVDDTASETEGSSGALRPLPKGVAARIDSRPQSDSLIFQSLLLRCASAHGPISCWRIDTLPTMPFTRDAVKASPPSFEPLTRRLRRP